MFGRLFCKARHVTKRLGKEFLVKETKRLLQPDPMRSRAMVGGNGGGYCIGLAYARDMIHPA
jgi:hypothetical protein